MQNKVVVKHTRIEINNYDLGDSPKLEYIFSVYNKMKHLSFFKGVEYDHDNKKLIIPRGVDVPYIENMFACSSTIDRHSDPYINQDPIPIRYLTKDNRQLEILKFILGKDQYAFTKGHSQLAINATTGAGKTFITVAAMCFTGTRLVIITSSLNWLKQWRDKILEYTPLSDKHIYMVSGAASIDKIFNRDPLQYKVFLVSHASIKSYGDSKGWDKISDLFKHLQCGMKVFDEAHLYFDNMAKIDYYTNTNKTLYLTATPERSSEDENRIYKLYFKNIPSISLFNEDEDPHVHYVAMHFNSHPHPLDVNKLSNNAYGFNRIGYVDYVVNRPKFLELVVVLVEMALQMNGKVLIYIGTNNGIYSVYGHICTVFPFLIPHVGIYTSIVDKDNKEKNLHKKIILSTTKSCGAASDIADLVCVINLAEPFRSSVLAKQTLGRCRKDNTMYIDVIDNGFFYTKKYYSAKKPIFSKYAKSCKDVAMNDDELEIRSNDIKNKYSQKKVMCMKIYKE